MGARKQGVRRESFKHFVLDAGAVILDWGEPTERVLGATEGGPGFNVEQDIREVEMDGAAGPVKLGRRVVQEHARITASMMELSPDNLQVALFGAVSEAHNGGHKITRTIATPGAEAYFKNVALVGRLQGSADPVVFVLKNAIADGNFELQMEDQNEAAPEIQFTAHFDPDNLEASPWEIIVPEASELVFHVLSYLAGDGGTVIGKSPQTVIDGGTGEAVGAIPDAGYVFAGWSDNVMDNPRTDTDVAADVTVTAQFDPE